jgi:hypothetical protein
MLLVLITIFFSVTLLSISVNLSNAHMFNSNNTQIWNNTEDNIRIEFGYLPEEPIIDTFTNLAFSVTNLRTGDHSAEGIVDYLFPDDGTHQVLLRLDKNDSINLASFQVFVPHQTPPDLVNNTQNVIIALALFGAVGLITIFIVRR